MQRYFDIGGGNEDRVLHIAQERSNLRDTLTQNDGETHFSIGFEPGQLLLRFQTITRLPPNSILIPSTDSAISYLLTQNSDYSPSPL